MASSDTSGFGAFVSDFYDESVRSFRAMSPAEQIAFAAGGLGFVVCEFFLPPAMDRTALAALRIAFLCFFIAGAVANARRADEFYRSVYLYSCAIALPVSAIAYYGAASFGADMGRSSIGYAVLIWFLSFLLAFARLRRG